MKIESVLEMTKNITIYKSFLKLNSIKDQYKNIVVSVSGGADSDLLVDMICRLSIEAKYIFFDTGLEYKATFDQLIFLEDKYNIEIDRIKVKKPIPTSIKEKGIPFLSKQVSEMMSRLQRHNFKWEDEEFDLLYNKYPNCKSALKWWCNKKHASLNIAQNKLLKEFIIANPPSFNISGYCCNGAKKNPSKNYIKNNDCDLMITGVRKAEGGSRKTAYKTCYNQSQEHQDNFYPILWYKNQDKKDYEFNYNVVHSDCYTVYGLERTGCAGCPFGRRFEFELNVLKRYEPKLHKAALNMFGESYEYTRKYKKFKDRFGKDYEQLTLF